MRTRAGSPSARKIAAVASASASVSDEEDSGAQQAIGSVVTDTRLSFVSMFINVLMNIDACQVRMQGGPTGGVFIL